MEQLKAVVKELETYFPDIAVFTEKIKFDNGLPCFLVKEKESLLQKELNETYRLTEVFEISYFDPVKSMKNGLRINEDLDLCLKCIDGIKGKKINFSNVDGTLKLEYQYSYRVYLSESEKTEKMNYAKIGMEMIFNG